MQYECEYVDGSIEIVESDDIGGAREQAKQLYECPIKKIVALGDDDEDAEPKTEKASDDDSGDDVATNPFGDEDDDEDE